MPRDATAGATGAVGAAEAASGSDSGVAAVAAMEAAVVAAGSHMFGRRPPRHHDAYWSTSAMCFICCFCAVRRGCADMVEHLTPTSANLAIAAAVDAAAAATTTHQPPTTPAP